MAKYNFIASDTRGKADYGWLQARQSFSFANYYDPARIHFGALRVLNDDIVAPENGFGTHPHDNMEIITIPMEGTLTHRDSMGNTEDIVAGEIQVMSAGTGIRHSEMNNDPNTAVKLLQIWLFPNKRNVTPRYEQKLLDTHAMQNTLLQIVGPEPNEKSVWIHQDAYFSMGIFTKKTTIEYTLKNPRNGVYAFIMKGNGTINNHKLNLKDALEISETTQINIEMGAEPSQLLLIEVPLEF
jgi:quercetin 2,3-dioxygenase